MQFEREEVIFDEQFGQWSHSAIHNLGEEADDIPFSQIEAFKGLDFTVIRVWDDDKIELLCGEGIHEGPADFRKWQPDPPKGDDWFPFSYGDNENGPYVVYVRNRDENAKTEQQEEL